MTQEDVLQTAGQNKQGRLAMELAYLLKFAQSGQEGELTIGFSEPFVGECYQSIVRAKSEGDDMQAICREVIRTFVANRLHPSLATLAAHL